MATLDIVIVGAGWHGLAMAKTYQEAVPDANMLIFDGSQSVGGTWAKERLYPGLKTNNLLGTYEFSDFPMTPQQFDVKPGHHIPGHAVHDYLVQFADHFSLTSRIKLRRKVELAELLVDGAWKLRIISTESEHSPSESWTIITSKLVVATGLTSEPFVPKFDGQDRFNRSLFHAKELRDRAKAIEDAQSVVVLGGNKSAWDPFFFAAKEGAHVHMVMRPDGGGPSWVWPVLFSSFKISIQRLATTRFFTWFDPCIWSENDGPVSWIRSALHGTYLGRKVVSKVWGLLESFAHSAHRYEEDPETQRLKPWISPFWMGNSLSIHNYTSHWFDLVREGRITVHVADVSSLTDGTVHLSNGVNLGVDALVCCTGWVTAPPIRFFPEGIEMPLGLRHCDNKENRELVNDARTEILTRLPALQASPRRSLPPGTVESKQNNTSSVRKVSHSYRLYRFLVPSDERLFARRNVAFIGSHLALNAIMIAQLQALWVTAYFLEEIPHLQPKSVDYSKVKYETVLHAEYSRLRHPHSAGGAGERCPDLTFDCLSYMDLLSMDLGLQRYRKFKKEGIFSEVWHRYGPSDFRNMVQDWLTQERKVPTYNKPKRL